MSGSSIDRHQDTVVSDAVAEIFERHHPDGTPVYSDEALRDALSFVLLSIGLTTNTGDKLPPMIALAITDLLLEIGIRTDTRVAEVGRKIIEFVETRNFDPFLVAEIAQALGVPSPGLADDLTPCLHTMNSLKTIGRAPSPHMVESGADALEGGVNANDLALSMGQKLRL